MKISIFIPIFNEEDILERDIFLIERNLKKLPYIYEIFVVDDGSFDRSSAIAKKMEASNKNIHHLRYNFGPTRRENLAQSFKEASGEIIAFMDVDLATNLRFIPNLIEEVRKGADIVTGSRYIKGAKIKRKLSRLIISTVYNVFIRFIFKTNIMDHECGFKAFKREVILQLVDEMGFDKSLNRGIFWDVELLVRALKHGYKIKEIPVWGRERQKSALNFRREIKMLSYILKFWGHNT